MESTDTKSDMNKIELIQAAIQQLLIQSKQTDDVDEDDRRLLTKLLSQVESIKGDNTVKLSEPSVELNKVALDIVDEAETKNMGETKASGSGYGDGAEVVTELKKLKRQNRTTHWLLSALIVVTVAWQISEISLLLKVKECLSHPLKSLGSVVTGALKPHEPDNDKESPTNINME